MVEMVSSQVVAVVVAGALAVFTAAIQALAATVGMALLLSSLTLKK
jgi:hypothetical protein